MKYNYKDRNSIIHKCNYFYSLIPLAGGILEFRKLAFRATVLFKSVYLELYAMVFSPYHLLSPCHHDKREDTEAQRGHEELNHRIIPAPQKIVIRLDLNLGLLGYFTSTANNQEGISS